MEMICSHGRRVLQEYCWTKILYHIFFFFSSRRRHTRCSRDWSSDVCSSDLIECNSILAEQPDTIIPAGLDALTSRLRRADQLVLSGIDADLELAACGAAGRARSEERRVGKECRARG